MPLCFCGHYHVLDPLTHPSAEAAIYSSFFFLAKAVKGGELLS